MENNDPFDDIRSYFQDRLDRFGTTPRGADWNSTEAQNIRFLQLAKVIIQQSAFSVLDFGCGYGAFADFLLENAMEFSHFCGYDILDAAVKTAAENHPHKERYTFSTRLEDLPETDYAVASGVFNIRLNSTYDQWTKYVFECLHQMDQKTSKGFAANFLTKYSDPERMVSKLFYADPYTIFDYCKRHFSRNVALLHDYNLYDFTIIVRKN